MAFLLVICKYIDNFSNFQNNSDKKQKAAANCHGNESPDGGRCGEKTDDDYMFMPPSTWMT